MRTAVCLISTLGLPDTHVDSITSMRRNCIVLVLVAFSALAYGSKVELNGINSEINAFKDPDVVKEQPMDTRVEDELEAEISRMENMKRRLLNDGEEGRPLKMERAGGKFLILDRRRCIPPNYRFRHCYR